MASSVLSVPKLKKYPIKTNRFEGGTMACLLPLIALKFCRLRRPLDLACLKRLDGTQYLFYSGLRNIQAEIAEPERQ